MPTHDVPGAVRLDDLTDRVPGQTLMAACLAEQAAAPPRGPLARVVGARVLTDAARSWYVGVVGERVTARLLEGLGPEHVVLHSIPVTDSGTDIDHLVVGPMGVVTVHTKHHRDARVWVGGDTVLVAGQRRPYVHAARSDRTRVLRALAALTLPVAPVTSLVAVVHAARVQVRRAPEDVRVVDARHLVRTLRRLPTVLGQDAVWALAGAVTSTETWGVRPEGEPADVVARFAALGREVRVARAARLAWAGAACAGVAAGLVAVVAAVPGLVGALFS
ncbi:MULTISPECIES: nuclease-related domain-containing protein [unclassified Curtobacterium]|uniref:nuclease-related domain-containing protein n=1 Tax=unclassified Curtobacterium TaxID=257496 RepID=UPI000DA9788C|nr:MULTISPECIES: nuclease-related domain-containing protein [unclassified Curtobacterium]PZE73506.1 hypothetical protein DEI82_13615 [Curtobacterium sp. MCBD17_019]WIE55473.1 nuclease-related domain-containing protein [Curtobacterium sp. MCBD17_003]